MSTPTRANRAGDSQELPTPNDRESIHDLMVRDVKDMFGVYNDAACVSIAEKANQRKALGVERYGTPLQAFNGRNCKLDAYEEAHDLAVYLRQWVYEIEEEYADQETHGPDWADAWDSYEKVLFILVILASHQ